MPMSSQSEIFFFLESVITDADFEYRIEVLMSYVCQMVKIFFLKQQWMARKMILKQSNKFRTKNKEFNCYEEFQWFLCMFFFSLNIAVSQKTTYNFEKFLKKNCFAQMYHPLSGIFHWRPLKGFKWFLWSFWDSVCLSK